MKTIKCNIKKSLLTLFAGVGIMAICIFFAFFNFRQYVDVSLFNNDIIYYLIKVFMIFALIFMGLGEWVGISKFLFYRDRMIEIGEDYLVDNSSYTCGGKIQYTEIQDIYIKGMFLCIKLYNEEQFLRRQNALKRWLMRGNKKMGYEYVVISNNLLDSDLYEIKKMIKEKMTR